MTDTEKSYSETEHFALLADAVRRETAEQASTREGLEAERSALQVKVTTLESELAAAVAGREEAETALADFKAELAEREAAAARESERVDAVRGVAPHLPDDYFTAERASTWGAMSDEVFTALISGLEAGRQAGAEVAERETSAAFRGGASPSAEGASGSSINQLFAARRGRP